MQNTNEQILLSQSGLTIAEILPLYFSKDAILVSPIKVFRIDDGGTRYYYTFDFENWQPEYFISITGLLSKTMPTSPHLIKWYADQGWEKANQQNKLKAQYGTLMHLEFSHFLIKEECDLNTLEDRVRQYVTENRIDTDILAWTIELKKDILAFAQFCIDYELKPLCIEGHFVSRETGIAGIIDLVCEMNEKNYTEKTELSKRKRVRAIIDYKSSKSGSFYESHEIQLAACKQMWEENFVDYPIDMLFNWSPTDWRKAPGYTLANQTDKESGLILPLLVEIARMKDVSPQRYLKMMQGVIEYKKPLTPNYMSINIDEFVRTKMSELKTGTVKEILPPEPLPNLPDRPKAEMPKTITMESGDIVDTDSGEVLQDNSDLPSGLFDPTQPIKTAETSRIPSTPDF